MHNLLAVSRWVLHYGWLALLVLLSPALAYPAEQSILQILTLPTGSKAYRAGVTLAAAITRHTPYQAIIAGYGGAQVIVPMLESNRAELALINADDATQGYRGVRPFRSKNENIRLISNAYNIMGGTVVAEDSDIRTINDIRGKRVTGVFSSHKSCELVARAQMANMGISRDEVRTVPVTNPVGSIQALAEGRADVALCVAPGIPAVLEADARVGIRYISMDPSDEAVTRLKQVFDLGSIVQREKGYLQDIKEDGFFISYDYYLVGSTHIPDELVEAVLNVLWNQHEELSMENRDFISWSRERMHMEDNPIPYHDAAIRFFESKASDSFR
jgi:TRAP transporter TAXI family solute receptor